MSRSDVTVTRAWVRQGTAFFVDWIKNSDLSGPSRLPGWTRAHVGAHVARNAEALTRLAFWARTGIETPMYASTEQRDKEIEASAQQSHAELVADVRATAAELETALDLLDESAWAATVRSARGRVIPATEIPWLRAREVWIHAVDLGASIDDLPADLVDELLDDVTAALPGPDVLLVATDRHRTWEIGSTPVSGTAAHLLAWLIGRSPGTDLESAAPLPQPPAWL
jgi:maleylpyruvate isomerase